MRKVSRTFKMTQGLCTHLINQRRLKLCSLIHCTFLGSLKESGKTHFRCYVSVMGIQFSMTGLHLLSYNSLQLWLYFFALSRGCRSSVRFYYLSDSRFLSQGYFTLFSCQSSLRSCMLSIIFHTNSCHLCTYFAFCIVFIKRIGYFMTDVIYRFRGFLVYGQICKGVCSVQLIFEYMQKKLKTKGLCWKLLSLQDADGTNISKT